VLSGTSTFAVRLLAHVNATFQSTKMVAARLAAAGGDTRPQTATTHEADVVSLATVRDTPQQAANA
jgi:hypothetical protein